MTVEKLQVKIGGMSCSFCTTTIQKAYSRMDGVQAVHVSLAHEEALIEYDPALLAPTELRDTLRDRRTIIWSIVFPTLVIPLIFVHGLLSDPTTWIITNLFISFMS